jgi:hypothetical protein
MLWETPPNPRRKKITRAKRSKCPECGKELVWIGDPDFPDIFRCLDKKCSSFYTRYYRRTGRKLEPLPIALAEELMRRRKLDG